MHSADLILLGAVQIVLLLDVDFPTSIGAVAHLQCPEGVPVHSPQLVRFDAVQIVLLLDVDFLPRSCHASSVPGRSTSALTRPDPA